MKVRAYIDTQYNVTAPKISIGCISDKIDYVLLEKQNIIDCNLELKDIDIIEICFLNKDDLDDNVVIIKKLLIDGIDIQHFIYEGEFKPIYDKNWYNSQVKYHNAMDKLVDGKPSLIQKPGTEMRHNGSWTLSVILPIWKMILNSWLEEGEQLYANRK